MLNNAFLHFNGTYLGKTLDAHSGLAAAQVQAASSLSDLVKGFIDSADFRNQIHIWQAAKYQGERFAVHLFIRRHYGSVTNPLNHQLWPISFEFCINAHLEGAHLDHHLNINLDNTYI